MVYWLVLDMHLAAAADAAYSAEQYAPVEPAELS